MKYFADAFMDDSNSNPESLDKAQEAKAVVQDKPIKKISHLAVASLIFALLGFLFLHIFSQLFMPLRPIYIPFMVLTLLFSAISAVLAIVSLVIIALRRENLRGCWFAIVAIFILGFLLFMLPAFQVTMGRGRYKIITSRLRPLHRAIIRYSKDHDGYLPVADKWCDLLIEYDKNLSKENFMYPFGRYGDFTFALNKSLDGLRLDDIRGDTVILFGAVGGWNVAGGAELLEGRYKDIQLGFVILPRQKNFALLANGLVMPIPFSREHSDEQFSWRP
ncbi:MAG: type II secretion system protein [Planctomycetota bacterium]|jgi:hypothetical protein